MNKNTKKVMFSSENDEWITPSDFYEMLEGIFGEFTLDPCSTDENAKCEAHHTMETDGLSMDWGGNNVYMNPPYSKIRKWMAKAHIEGLKDNTRVVCLVPARTETQWYHDYALRAKAIFFVKRRIKFNHPIKEEYIAPFPSIVVVFDGVHTWPEFGKLGRNKKENG